MTKIKIKRTKKLQDRTIGELSIDGVKFAGTLELPWRKNAWMTSCVPAGEYRVKKRHSIRHGHHLHILDVPGRSWILIHAGNTPADTTGCVLVGKIDGTHLRDSRATLSMILQRLSIGSEFLLEVVNETN